MLHFMQSSDLLLSILCRSVKFPSSYYKLKGYDPGRLIRLHSSPYAVCVNAGLPLSHLESALYPSPRMLFLSLAETKFRQKRLMKTEDVSGLNCFEDPLIEFYLSQTTTTIFLSLNMLWIKVLVT